MSHERFIEYLQQLLTMVDANDRKSVKLARQSLEALVELAQNSGKVDRITYSAMHYAVRDFYRLIDHRSEFAGVPGETTENSQKRHRLALALDPAC